MIRSALLRLSRSAFLERQMKRRRFARRAVRRFMPGEELDDALEAGALLHGQGLGVVFTRLGENVASPDEASAVAHHYLDALGRVTTDALDAEISVKPTQLGLDIDLGLATTNLERLVRRADELDNMVWVDMEDSSCVDATLDLVRAARARSPRVGVCLQAYLHRTTDDIATLTDPPLRVRLVKGAYREPARVALQSRKAVDARYHELAALMIEDRQYATAAPPVFGTHDHRLIERVRASAREHGLAPGQLEFHLLYGVRTDLQRSLADHGARVRVLISYGDHWFPWYMRRLAERPANVWFVARQLLTP